MIYFQVLAASETFDIASTLRDAFESMGRDIIAFVPRLIVGLILLFVGCTFALVISKVIKGVCKKAKIDEWFQKTSIGQQFGGSKELSIGAIVGKLLFWLITLFVIRAAASSVGMESITSLLERIFNFLPKAFVAIIIAAVGFTIADIARRGVTAALQRFGLDYAGAIGSIIFGFILVLSLSSALAQLGVDAQLLEASVMIIISGFALALAIGFGLGMKEASAGLISGIYARDIYKPGCTVRLDGESYELVGIGPLTTKLQKTDGTSLVIPNKTLTSDKVSAHR